jgi:lysine-N-methylase
MCPSETQAVAPGDRKLRQTQMMQPNYAGRFRCTGPACEDNCCSGWIISVDEPTHRKYDDLPASSLRTLIAASILRNPSADPKVPFATIQMLPSGVCPLLSEQHLCRIHGECGESYLCRTCAEFPRTTLTIDGLKETALTLSCPEAARLVLLAPNLFPPPSAPGHQLTWDETASTATALRPYFWPIREFVVGLILNRKYPLWQRLFLVGSFCRRLQALSQGEPSRKFSQILDDFSRAVAAGGLCSAMEGIPADLNLQLEIVLRVIAQRVNGIPIRPRLRQVLEMFVEGIGHSRAATLEAQVSRYAHAYRQFYVPFFRRRPRILENYLVNMVLRDVFPFGKKLFEPEAEPEPAKAFAMLAIQFALTKGLLIGVAGAAKHRFSAADVVRTIETAFRHFEHNAKFLSDAYDMLGARGLVDARGLTMLLRN